MQMTEERGAALRCVRAAAVCAVRTSQLSGDVATCSRRFEGVIATGMQDLPALEDRLSTAAARVRRAQVDAEVRVHMADCSSPGPAQQRRGSSCGEPSCSQRADSPFTKPLMTFRGWLPPPPRATSAHGGCVAAQADATAAARSAAAEVARSSRDENVLRELNAITACLEPDAAAGRCVKDGGHDACASLPSSDESTRSDSLRCTRQPYDRGASASEDVGSAHEQPERQSHIRTASRAECIRSILTQPGAAIGAGGRASDVFGERISATMAPACITWAGARDENIGDGAAGRQVAAGWRIDGRVVTASDQAYGQGTVGVSEWESVDARVGRLLAGS